MTLLVCMCVFTPCDAAPAAGWPSVDVYYAQSSSSLSIPNVKIPLLCIQALDDPIAPKEAIPYAELAANTDCVLVVTPCGGHLGWVSGPGAPFGHPWTDVAVVQWLKSVLQELRVTGAPQQEHWNKLQQARVSQSPPLSANAAAVAAANTSTIRATAG